MRDANGEHTTRANDLMALCLCNLAGTSAQRAAHQVLWQAFFMDLEFNSAAFMVPRLIYFRALSLFDFPPD